MSTELVRASVLMPERKTKGPIRPNPPIGSVFNRLTVVSDWQTKGYGFFATVRCVCGTEKVIAKNNLLSGRVGSCGCLLKEFNKEVRSTHGLAGTPTYNTWTGMKARCQVPTNPNYSNYGGRGIKISEDWQTFEGFYKDMGESPFKGASIERLDTNGNYCKENCVWADSKTQNSNRRDNVLWEYKGVKYSLAELAKLSGLGYKMLSNRLYRSNWSVARAVETPKISLSDRANMKPETGPTNLRYRLYD